MITQFGLEEFANQKPDTLSGGYKRRLMIARAVVHQPRLVFLDEPTNGLDVMTTRGLREFLKQLRSEGRCVIFSSHIMQEVAALCDRIVVIAHGEVRAIGSPDELREQTGLVQQRMTETWQQVQGQRGEAGQLLFHRGVHFLLGPGHTRLVEQSARIDVEDR